MKRLVLFSVFIFLAVCANAQNFKSYFNLGINASQVDGDGMGGYNKVGIMGGMGITYKASEKPYSFQGELNYSRKGSRFNPAKDPYFILRLNYIELPFFVNYHYKEKVTFYGGIYGSMLVNSTIDSSIYGFGSYNAPKNDQGILGGLSYKFSDKLELSGRFTYTVITNRFMWANNVLTYSLRIWL